MLEIVASLWLGIMVVVSVMAGVMKLDNYLYRRKRVRELDTQHKAFMKNRRLDQAHRDMMMRTGMNPVFQHSVLCSPSRHGVMTSENPIMTAQRQATIGELRSTLGLTPYPPPRVITPEEVREIMNVDVPKWDGVAVEAQSLVRFHDDPIPAPALFAKQLEKDDAD